MREEEKKILIAFMILFAVLIFIGICTADTAREAANAITALITYCIISVITYLLLGTKK